ncbi:MAG: apolipoprotein N-acyltransferase [Oleiphilaceae bacterium]|jgi:apolipoprotein N-acyltransferase
MLTGFTVSRSKLYTLLGSSWICLLSGILMAFAYAPVSQAWLVFFLLLPLWIVARHPDPNTRIWRGWLFGLGYFPIGASWFAQTLRTHLDYSWPTALAGHLLITGACALAPTVFCWLAGYCKAKSFAKVLALAALWMVIEDIRFQAFGGGPWMSLGLSQVDMPFAGLFPLVGELGTSFFVALVVGVLAWMFFGDEDKASSWISAKRCLLGFVFIGLLLLTTHSLKQIEWTRSVGEPQPIALVQSAVTQDEKKNLASQVERLQVLITLSDPFLAKARLIIWPETVVTLDRFDVNQKLRAFHEKAIFSRSSVLVGAYEPGLSGKRYNTAYTIGFESGQAYQKRHLVPFGEYVPKPLSFLDDYVPGDTYRYHGRMPSLIANSGVLYGISICWEGSFSRDISPLTRAGAHALINIANEAWFAGSTLPWQNLDAMRVRAMENGRYAVRVANYGPGAIIDHKGQISHLIEADQMAGELGYIQPRTGVTPFMFLGEDLLTLMALFLLLGIVLKNRTKQVLHAGKS